MNCSCFPSMHTHTHTHPYRHVHTYIHSCTNMYVYTHTQPYTCMCTHLATHTHSTNTFVLTCANTRTHTPIFSFPHPGVRDYHGAIIFFSQHFPKMFLVYGRCRFRILEPSRRAGCLGGVHTGFMQ